MTDANSCQYDPCKYHSFFYEIELGITVRTCQDCGYKEFKLEKWVPY